MGDLVWNGGPVQENPAAYVIFWGSGWSTSSGAGRVIYNYFHDVGHTAFQNTMTQYYDGTQAITNSLSLGGFWIDTSTPPTETINCSGVPAVDDSRLQAEVQHAISVNGWADDPNNASYFVYTPSGDAIWQASIGCSTLGGGSYCAYHSYFSGSALAGQRWQPTHVLLPSTRGSEREHRRRQRGESDLARAVRSHDRPTAQRLV
jgi:hypothetical protein